MKRLLSFLAIVALIISSCVPAEQGLVPDSVLLEGKELTVKAIMGDVAATKTAIQSNGTSIYWTKSDDINLFYGSSLSGRFTTGINSPSATADFSGTLASTGESNSGIPAFWAVYPYNAANTCDGTSVTLTIPETQVGIAGTFADKLNPSVAKASDTNLSFFNVGSWFIFSVAEEGVVSATLKGNGNEIIAGKVRVTMDVNSRPVAEVIEGEGKQSITMTPAAGGSFAVGSYYYFVLLPQSLANGYTLTLTKSDNSSADCVIPDERVFSRAQYRMKSSADEGLVYIPEGNIEFADGNVKTICVNHWDTNGDNELSYAEAAAVTSIPYGLFTDNTTITSFDEFQYFTSVTSLGYYGDYDEGMDYYGAFSGCAALTSIILPPSLHDISFGAFRYCSSLESITIPATVTRIGQVAFDGCTKLKVIMESGTPCTLYPDSYGTYPGETCAFGLYNNRVKAILVPTDESVTAYKAAQYWSDYSSLIHKVGWVHPTDAIVFTDAKVKAICVDSATGWDTNGDGELSYQEAASVTDLTTVFSSHDSQSFDELHIQSFDELQYFTGLSEIPDGAFFYCDCLESITLPEGITRIGNSAFFNCSKLAHVNLPNSLLTIGTYSFNYCPELVSLAIPDNVTIAEGSDGLRECAFYCCCNLTSITVSPENSKYDSRDNCNALIETSTNKLLLGCKNTVIPSTVTSIGAGAFYSVSCSSITIPQSVLKIETGAFICSIPTIVMESTTPPELWCSEDYEYLGVFSDNICITVPSSSLETYKSAPGWSDYASIIVGY